MADLVLSHLDTHQAPGKAPGNLQNQKFTRSLLGRPHVKSATGHEIVQMVVMLSPLLSGCNRFNLIFAAIWTEKNTIHLEIDSDWLPNGHPYAHTGNWTAADKIEEW
jgi:hypothetical protein